MPFLSCQGGDGSITFTWEACANYQHMHICSLPAFMSPVTVKREKVVGRLVVKSTSGYEI